MRAFSLLWVRSDMGRISKAFSTGVKNIKAKCNPKKKENRAFSFATLGELWVRADMGRISKAFSTGPKNIRAK